MRNLLYCLQQLKTLPIGTLIFKIHPLTIEIWKQVPLLRVIWSTCQWSATVRETYSTAFCSMTCMLLNFKNPSTDSWDMKSCALATWHLVHVPMVIYSKGDLLNCILQLRACQIATWILKIHPQTAEIWNQVPWPRGIWSTCLLPMVIYSKGDLLYCLWMDF